jgi:tetratricopeptide (TPR) repeat protein
MPALVAARFHRWDEVLKIPAPAGNLPMSTYLWNYAQGMAHASSAHTEKALAALKTMRALAPAAEKVPLNSQGTLNSEHVVKITDHLLEARIAQANRNPKDELEHLRQAVALEDELDYNEPPDWIAPVRERLGAALLRVKRPSEAEKVFREDLTRNPNNGRSLFGLAESLRAQKKSDAAARADFQHAWKSADVKLTLGDL